ncbi:MAG: hypothetical protein K8S25_10140 [Alphaproteobacteria bacterium]|nr:hypothetical protein [Alphaproteobacteria bacterium]
MTLRLKLLGAAALTVGVFFGAGAAMAQPVPPGSYQGSCSSISSYGGTLRAQCRTRDGDLIESRLENYRDCDGDIGNDNGSLTCAMNDDANPGGGASVPPGSYQSSCQNERVDGGDLLADCADRNGRTRHSELQNFRRCRDDINNDNGELRCGDNDDAGNDGDFTVPSGTWRASCRDYRVTRNVLVAECRDRYGRWVDSSVDLRSCRLGVSNVNGNLVCNVPAVPLGWRISLYRDIAYRGTGRTFTGDVPNLANYGFANMVSSAYLRSGAWQVCTRTYYRGQCVTLRTSAPNFVRLGINDRARSLRRVR